jgi:hypothetical protein
MSGFSVSGQDLQSYAYLLGAAGGKPGSQQEAVDEASRYLAKYATLPEGTSNSLFGRVGVHHAEIYSAVSQGLKHADHALGGSAQALLTVKQNYAGAEVAIEAQIDATLPHVSRPPQPFGYQSSFSGLTDPATLLKTPDVPGDYPDPTGPVRSLLNWITGSAVVESVVTQALGWNPYERYAEAFAGDWHAFARAGQAFGSAGSCAWQVGDNIGSGNQALGRAWQGNAADAAFAYFDTLASDVRFFGNAVSGLEQPYLELADSAFAASQGIADLLHELTDDVLLIIITVAAGGTIEIAARLAHLLPEFAKAFLEKISSAMALAELLVGMARELQAAGDIQGAAGYVYGSPVPGGAYQPPSALA